MKLKKLKMMCVTAGLSLCMVMPAGAFAAEDAGQPVVSAEETTQTEASDGAYGITAPEGGNELPDGSQNNQETNLEVDAETQESSEEIQENGTDGQDTLQEDGQDPENGSGSGDVAGKEHSEGNETSSEESEEASENEESAENVAPSKNVESSEVQESAISVQSDEDVADTQETMATSQNTKVEVKQANLRTGFVQIPKEYAIANVYTHLHVRENPSLEGRIIGKLNPDALCYIIADAEKDWIYVESGDVRGFVYAKYLITGIEAESYVVDTGEDNMELADMIVSAEENKAFDYCTDTVYEVPVAEQPYYAYTGATGNAIVNYARQFVGNPYLWGGNSLTDGIDCSHFVWQVLKNCGAYDGGYYTSYGWRTLGTEVPDISEAQAGDVICYDGHVAIYDGNGKIIEAQSRKAGITDYRNVNCKAIISIRRFATAYEWKGTSDIDDIYEYLIDQGLSKAGASGVIGNIYQESGGKPDTYSRTGKFYGLCQWGGGRKTGLQSFCNDNLLDYTSAEGQAKFIMYELQTTFPSLLQLLMTTDDPVQAAQEFCVGFEKCIGGSDTYYGTLYPNQFGKNYQQMDERAGYAAEYFYSH